jgi:anti-sigma B factor antagonist
VTAPVQGVEHVVLPADLDLAGAPAAKRLLAAAMAGPAHAVVVHLDEVEFIDSSGLRVLVSATEAAEHRGIDLRILPGRLEVMSVIEAAALAGRLPFVGWP